MKNMKRSLSCLLGIMTMFMVLAVSFGSYGGETETVPDLVVTCDIDHAVINPVVVENNTMIERSVERFDSVRYFTPSAYSSTLRLEKHAVNVETAGSLHIDPGDSSEGSQLDSDKSTTGTNNQSLYQTNDKPTIRMLTSPLDNA